MQTFSLKVKLVVIVRGVLVVLEKRLIDRCSGHVVVY